MRCTARAYRVGGSDVTQDAVQAHSAAPRLALETGHGGRDARTCYERRRAGDELEIYTHTHTHTHTVTAATPS